MAKKQAQNKKNSKQNQSFLNKPALWIALGALIIIIIAVVLFNGNGSSSAGLATEISTAKANQLYNDKSAFFVDVREQDEWDSFHIPGTTLIPLGQLASRLNEVPKDKPIVVVCRSGNRSKQGRDILLQAGYTNVTSMAGGVTEWKTNGYPIEP